MNTLLQAFIARKGRALASLLLIFVAVIFNAYWLWGLLLLFWAVNDLVRGHTWLTEDVARLQDPILFYLIVITWLIFGFYLSFSPFAYLLR